MSTYRITRIDPHGRHIVGEPGGYYAEDAEILAAGVTGHPLATTRNAIERLSEHEKCHIARHPADPNGADIEITANPRDSPPSWNPFTPRTRVR